MKVCSEIALKSIEGLSFSSCSKVELKERFQNCEQHNVFGFLLAIQAFYSIKKASIKCPECDKPIMTKSHTFDQSLITESAYEKCYFCGHEFK